MGEEGSAGGKERLGNDTGVAQDSDGDFYSHDPEDHRYDLGIHLPPPERIDLQGIHQIENHFSNGYNQQSPHKRGRKEILRNQVGTKLRDLEARKIRKRRAIAEILLQPLPRSNPNLKNYSIHVDNVVRGVLAAARNEGYLMDDPTKMSDQEAWHYLIRMRNSMRDELDREDSEWHAQLRMLHQ